MLGESDKKRSTTAVYIKTRKGKPHTHPEGPAPGTSLRNPSINRGRCLPTHSPFLFLFLYEEPGEGEGQGCKYLYVNLGLKYFTRVPANRKSSSFAAFTPTYPQHQSCVCGNDTVLRGIRHTFYTVRIIQHNNNNNNTLLYTEGVPTYEYIRLDDFITTVHMYV